MDGFSTLPNYAPTPLRIPHRFRLHIDQPPAHRYAIVFPRVATAVPLAKTNRCFDVTSEQQVPIDITGLGAIPFVPGWELPSGQRAATVVLRYRLSTAV